MGAADSAVGVLVPRPRPAALWVKLVSRTARTPYER